MNKFSNIFMSNKMHMRKDKERAIFPIVSKLSKMIDDYLEFIDEIQV